MINNQYYFRPCVNCTELINKRSRFHSCDKTIETCDQCLRPIAEVGFNYPEDRIKYYCQKDVMTLDYDKDNPRQCLNCSEYFTSKECYDFHYQRFCKGN